MGINIDTISTHSSCFQNGSLTTYYTEHTFSVAKIRPAFIRMQHDTDLSAAVRCDKHIPPSVIIFTRQRFSAHANHRYIGSSRVIPKLAISHSTTFPVADLAPTMVLLQNHNVGIRAKIQSWDLIRPVAPCSIWQQEFAKNVT